MSYSKRVENKGFKGINQNMSASRYLSLPLVSEGRLKAAITLLCKKKEGLQKIALDGIDTKRSDIRRLLNILETIEEFDKNNQKYIKFSRKGIKYFCNKKNDDEFKNSLNSLFLISLDEYEFLVDILLSYSKNVDREELYNKIQQKLWERGRNFDKPGFSTLIALSKISGVIDGTAKGKLVINFNCLYNNYYESKVLKIINKKRNVEGDNVFVQTKSLIGDILSIFGSDLELSDYKIYEILLEKKDYFDISFRSGVGESYIESEHAVIIIK